MDALSKVVNSQSLTNFPAIFEGFKAKGIDEADIKPRENVFTYKAWLELGRQVRKGEKGVKVVTFISKKVKNKAGEVIREDKRPWTSTVFHISQTDAKN